MNLTVCELCPYQTEYRNVKKNVETNFRGSYAIVQSYLTFRSTFFAYVQLRSMVAILLLLNIYIHYMFRPNWPYSRVQVAFVRQLLSRLASLRPDEVKFFKFT
jgi:hypothetical protein